MRAFPIALVACTLLTGCGKDRNDHPDTDTGDGPCHLGGLCTPFEWSCDEGGVPVECSVHGDSWIPRDPCAAGQTCDPDTGWCECGPCEVRSAEGCLRVGARCAEGWSDDGECGCEPVLDTCAGDEIALIGGGCAPVGARDDCGTGTWGNIPTDGDTIYVDESSTSGSPDGSRSSPFLTISDAVSAIPDGLAEPRTVAIAAGTYQQVHSTKPVALIGRCPSMVTVTMPARSSYGVLLEADRSSVESLTVDARHTINAGIVIDTAIGVRVENTVIRAAIDIGIFCQECEAEITGVTILDTDRAGIGGAGDAIQAHPGYSVDGCSIAVRRADIVWASRDGIMTHDCPTIVQESRIESTGQCGIHLQGTGVRRDADISSNVVVDAGMMGIDSEDGIPLGNAVVSRNRLLRAVHDPGFNDLYAISLGTSADTLVVEQNVVEESTGGGMILRSSGLLQVLGNLVLDSTGRGIEVPDAHGGAELIDNTIDTAGGMGIFVHEGADVTAEHNTARSVSPQELEEVGEPTGIEIVIVDTSSVNLNAMLETPVGIGILEGSGPATVRHNLVQPSILGLQISDCSGEDVALVEGNRFHGGAMGAGIIRCSGYEARLIDNTIGPLANSFEWAGWITTQGLYGHQPRSLSVEGNRIEISSPASDETWTYGINFSASGDTSVTLNRIVGALAGIMLRAERDAPLSIVGNSVVEGSGVGIMVDLLNYTTAGSITISSNTTAWMDTDTWPTGLTYGDGIALVSRMGSAEATISDNLLIGNGRTGFIVSGALVAAEGNDIHHNAISAAWQGGADVSLLDNDILCNDSDQPWVDHGMSVPDPPEIAPLP